MRAISAPPPLWLPRKRKPLRWNPACPVHGMAKRCQTQGGKIRTFEGQCVVGEEATCCCVSIGDDVECGNCQDGTGPAVFQLDVTGGSVYDGTFFLTAFGGAGSCRWHVLNSPALCFEEAEYWDLDITTATSAQLECVTTLGQFSGFAALWSQNGTANDCDGTITLSAGSSGTCPNAGTTAVLTAI